MKMMGREIFRLSLLVLVLLGRIPDWLPMTLNDVLRTGCWFWKMLNVRRLGECGWMTMSGACMIQEERFAQGGEDQDTHHYVTHSGHPFSI
jgi:hypothetical protein